MRKVRLTLILSGWNEVKPPNRRKAPYIYIYIYMCIVYNWKTWGCIEYPHNFVVVRCCFSKTLKLGTNTVYIVFETLDGWLLKAATGWCVSVHIIDHSGLSVDKLLTSLNQSPHASWMLWILIQPFNHSTLGFTLFCQPYHADQLMTKIMKFKETTLSSYRILFKWTFLLVFKSTTPDPWKVWWLMRSHLWDIIVHGLRRRHWRCALRQLCKVINYWL